MTVQNRFDAHARANQRSRYLQYRGCSGMVSQIVAVSLNISTLATQGKMEAALVG